MRDFLAGKISEREYKARMNARGYGAVAGTLVVTSFAYGPEAVGLAGETTLNLLRASLFHLRILTSSATTIMLGQTMSRVRAVANTTGSLTFETDAAETEIMWTQNKTWIDTAIKYGYKLFDIGANQKAIGPGLFHPMEERYLIDQGFHRINAGITFVQGELVQVYQWVKTAQ
jgi:hypothetical protein